MSKLKRRVKVRNAVPSSVVQFVHGKAIHFILGEILKGEHMECRGKKQYSQLVSQVRLVNNGVTDIKTK